MKTLHTEAQFADLTAKETLQDCFCDLLPNRYVIVPLLLYDCSFTAI